MQITWLGHGTCQLQPALLIASGKPVTLVSLGSLYLLRAFPKVGAYLTTYSTVLVAFTVQTRRS